MSNEWRFWKKEYWSDFKLDQAGVQSFGCLQCAQPGHVEYRREHFFRQDHRQHRQHDPKLRPPVHDQRPGRLPQRPLRRPADRALIISSFRRRALAGSLRGIVFMFAMGILLLLGLIGRLGKYLPAQSIACRFSAGHRICPDQPMPNLSAVAGSDQPVCGFVALGVTALVEKPFPRHGRRSARALPRFLHRTDLGGSTGGGTGYENNMA